MLSIGCCSDTGHNEDGEVVLGELVVGKLKSKLFYMEITVTKMLYWWIWYNGALDFSGSTNALFSFSSPGNN